MPVSPSEAIGILQPQTSAFIPQLVDVPVFKSPRRPNLGRKGRSIALHANYFQISIPQMIVHNYNISIQPNNYPQMVNRKVFQTMVAAYKKVFSSIQPVFDGKKNFYTKDPLPFGKDQVELEVILPTAGKDRVFRVFIKWLAQISLVALEESLRGRAKQIPYDAILALDTVMRYFTSMTYTPVGKSYFFPPERECHLLDGGREIWQGVHQSVRPSRWKMMLNIDVTATAFYKPQSVLEFMCETLNIGILENKPLSSVRLEKFTREIKDLKIEVTHCGKIRRKYKVIDVTRKSAEFQSFPLQLENGQIVDCTVTKYFLDRYKIKLNYPHLPCLHVGKEHSHIYLPIEVCNLSAGQRCIKKLTDMQTSSMIKQTSLNAPDREQEINSLIHQANLNNDPYVKEFGLTISNSMMKVSGRVLPPPKLQYGGGTSLDQEGFNGQQVFPKQGVWDMKGKQFFTGVEIRIWALACFVPQKTVDNNELIKFSTQLQKISRDAGMPIISHPCFCKYAIGPDQVEPMFNYLKSTFTGLQLLIIILPGKTPVYAEVKRVGDNVLGIATQCIQARNVKRPSIQVLSNLCLKINVKLGGINSILVPSIRPKVFNEPILFLGANVTHPPANDEKKQSIAGVVGSMDAHPSRYAATVLLQQHRQENIQELSSMVKEHLIMFYKSTGGFKPHRIILYRDGVSERQFSRILQYELTAIREACIKLEGDYKPGITFIAVQRHHHTRLFCADKKDQCGKSGNIPAGTIVDVGITHPTEFDFFLCSHQGIQGTSRPSHYHVLWDDNNFESDELQILTYQLCHTYVKCTRSVSIPAPLYYAHLATFRSRYHLTERQHDSVDGSYKSNHSEDKTSSLNTDAIKVHANTKKVMYFA
ncbi:protein argonaute-2-like [Rhopalosiphum padi]|uniref:protein argonaute-2-like n=1 Tax=Rhopalosiphum padi TaxID=40932 RepID=UPI00298E498F|nr:protein argonaute-2-like [Rhopalosiphum padi]